MSKHYKYIHTYIYIYIYIYNDTRYINTKSNHPLSILKEIPAAISNRISINSSKKQIFQRAAPYYNNILKDCGYKDKIQFQQYEHQQTQPRRN